MKRKSLLFKFIPFFIFILFLAACGSDNSNSSESGEDEVFTLKFTSQVGHWSNYLAGAEAFKENVEERSDGRIQIEFYLDGQLGDEREILESLQTGVVEMATVTPITFNSFDERITLLDLPFLFADFSEAEKALAGPIGEEVTNIFLDNGIRPLAYGHGEFRWINTSKKLVKTPSDIQGIQFRVPLSQVLVDYYTSMGANAVTMGNAEVYTALQQGVVEAYDNGAELVLLQNFYENTKYSTATNHNYYPVTVSISEQIWGTLPEDLQVILEEESKTYMEVERQAVVDGVAENTEILIEHGLEIIEINEEEREQWIEASQFLHDEMKDVLGEELYQLIMEEKENGFE